MYIHWSNFEILINKSIKELNNEYFLIQLHAKYINGKYISEGYVDYIGYIKNVFIGIEAKKTINKMYFYFSKISNKQHHWLKKFESLGLGLLFFYFEYYDKYVLIKYNDFIKISAKNKCLITSIIKLGVRVKYDFILEKLLIKNSLLKFIKS